MQRHGLAVGVGTVLGVSGIEIGRRFYFENKNNDSERHPDSISVKPTAFVNVTSLDSNSGNVFNKM